MRRRHAASIGAAGVLGLAALAVATVRNEYYFFAAYVVFNSWCSRPHGTSSAAAAAT